MTHEQAGAELLRLCSELGVNMRTLSEPQVEAWIRKLTSMSYEWGREAITRVVDTWSDRGFPRVGFLTRCADEIMTEGVPNAGAYSQDLRHAPKSPQEIDRLQYSVWRQQQIEALDDDDYWDLLHNRHAMSRFNRWCREQWETGSEGSEQPDHGAQAG